MLYRSLALALSVPAVLAAGGHDNVQQCSCAATNPEAPFTIDCTDIATINAATVTLETTCKTSTVEYEWGGAFATPATAYKWVAQAVGGAYADPAMKLVVFDIEAADSEHLMEMAETANTLMKGSCPVVNSQGAIAKPTAAGACYTLTFPTDVTTDFHATVDTTGVANVAFFGEHVPTEFERDTHYFMSTDLATDIEPGAETNAEEYNCKLGKNSANLMECKQAFFIIQAHHDYCPHDTLTRYEEELFHEWETKCYGCIIKRKYDPTLKKCPLIDCKDTTVAELGYSHLHANCVKADVSYPFEWSASFDTPANAYTWVSQAATDDSTAASGKKYADAEMMIVAFAMSTNLKSDLHSKKDPADTLMKGTCPTITASCTPADTSCTMPTITPTTAGVCYTIQFPNSAATLKDFMATVDTTNVAHVAFFTAHGPTEFERDTHYFMSTDLATDVEPVSTLGAAAAHDHGRRLSVRMNEGARKPRHRRLADPGTCCTTGAQQGAWKQVVAYHDICNHADVPEYIEVGFHDYEASCENYFCNLVEATDDQLTCPPPPPPSAPSPPAAPPAPPSPPSPPAAPPAPPSPPHSWEVSPTVTSTVNGNTGTSALSGGGDGNLEMSAVWTIVGCGIGAIVLLLAFICIMVFKEKKGKPIFTNVGAAGGISTTTTSDAAKTESVEIQSVTIEKA